MANQLQRITAELAARPRQLFLVDGLGALLTVGLLAGLLARFEALFGMPQRVCYVLAGVVVLYAGYSLGCYFFVRNRWRLFISIVAAANLLYCVVTAALVVSFYQQIRWPGFLYFFLEIFVILLLVRVERMVALKMTAK